MTKNQTEKSEPAVDTAALTKEANELRERLAEIDTKINASIYGTKPGEFEAMVRAKMDMGLERIQARECARRQIAHDRALAAAAEKFPDLAMLKPDATEAEFQQHARTRLTQDRRRNESARAGVVLAGQFTEPLGE